MSHRSLFCLACSAASLMIAAAAALADECSATTPDYSATRTVTVGGRTLTLRVFVSGSKVREEQDLGDGRKMVVLRLREQHVIYAFDPNGHVATRMPLPPPPDSNKGRVVNDHDPDGLQVKRLQVLDSGYWVDASTITCSRQGIMLKQHFVSVTAQGAPTAGDLSQSDIQVTKLPASLFQLPENLTVRSE